MLLFNIYFIDLVNPSALKAIGCGCALIAFSQMTAVTSIASYAVLIFQKVGTSIDPYTSTIILGVTLIFGSLASTYLADKCGRKTLNLISLCGCACGHLITATFYYFSISGHDLSAFSWLPVVSLSFIIFTAAIGIMPLALVCAVEILPPKVSHPFFKRIINSLFVLDNPILMNLLHAPLYRFVQLEWE